MFKLILKAHVEIASTLFSWAGLDNGLMEWLSRNDEANSSVSSDLYMFRMETMVVSGTPHQFVGFA